MTIIRYRTFGCERSRAPAGRHVSRPLAAPVPLHLLLLLLLLAACAHAPSDAGAGGFLDRVGFHARRTWESAVVHLGPEQLRSGADPVVAIVTATGRKLEPSVANPWGLYRRRDGEPELCEIAVHFNGARAVGRDYGLDVTLDELLRLRPPDGVELHFGSEGPLRDPTACGVLLVWRADWDRLGVADFTGTIIGVVVDRGAEPVVALRLDPPGRLVEPGPGGSFAFDGLLPGRYEVALLTDQGEITRHAVRVFAFETSRVELQVGAAEHGR